MRPTVFTSWNVCHSTHSLYEWELTQWKQHIWDRCHRLRTRTYLVKVCDRVTSFWIRKSKFEEMEFWHPNILVSAKTEPSLESLSFILSVFLKYCPSGVDHSLQTLSWKRSNRYYFDSRIKTVEWQVLDIFFLFDNSLKT